MILFKPEVAPSDFAKLNPFLKIIIGHFESYALQHELPVLVTSLISDRVHIKKQSSVHREARGCDISIRGWDTFHRERVKHYLNSNFAVEWGTRPVDSHIMPRVCIIHGDPLHFHLQVRRDIVISNLN